jgi:hypothetical protein
MPRKVEGIAVWVAVDPGGDEGLMGWRDPKNGDWMPLVATLGTRAEALNDRMARNIAALNGKLVRKVKYTNRVVAETFDGRQRN